MTRSLRRGLRRTAWFPLVVVSLVLLSSCSKDEVASGSLVGPSLGPRVDQSLLALGVVAGVPVGITSLFEQLDDVHLWVRWASLVPPQL